MGRHFQPGAPAKLANSPLYLTPLHVERQRQRGQRNPRFHRKAFALQDVWVNYRPRLSDIPQMYLFTIEESSGIILQAREHP